MPTSYASSTCGFLDFRLFIFIMPPDFTLNGSFWNVKTHFARNMSVLQMFHRLLTLSTISSCVIFLPTASAIALIPFGLTRNFCWSLASVNVALHFKNYFNLIGRNSKLLKNESCIRLTKHLRLFLRHCARRQMSFSSGGYFLLFVA